MILSFLTLQIVPISPVPVGIVWQRGSTVLFVNEHVLDANL